MIFSPLWYVCRLYTTRASLLKDPLHRTKKRKKVSETVVDTFFSLTVGAKLLLCKKRSGTRGTRCNEELRDSELLIREEQRKDGTARDEKTNTALVCFFTSFRPVPALLNVY